MTNCFSLCELRNVAGVGAYMSRGQGVIIYLFVYQRLAKRPGHHKVLKLNVTLMLDGGRWLNFYGLLEGPRDHFGHFRVKDPEGTAIELDDLCEVSRETGQFFFQSIG